LANVDARAYIGGMARHDHAHHEHSGKSLVNAARDALVEAGEQWTGMRESVFSELAQHDRPASAYDIADNLSRSRGKRVAPNSVYRILDLFVANNLALRVESANAYLANTHPGCEHDCIFLVCDECGDTLHVDNDEVSQTIRGIAQSRSFKPERPVIEVRGLCKSCVG
jgi:Fur family zinc uptake transcriptional regulator